MLNDASKTAVISQRGMAQAIGFSRRGSRLTVFVNSQTMDGYIGRDLKDKIEKPLVFQPSTAAAANSVSPGRAHGYDAAILIDLCNSILEAKADGKLKSKRYQRMAEQAQLIISASARNPWHSASSLSRWLAITHRPKSHFSHLKAEFCSQKWRFARLYQARILMLNWGGVMAVFINQMNADRSMQPKA